MVILSKKRKAVRYLRKNQTNAEKVVWNLLRNRKYKKLKFKRQYIIEGFIVDFYCFKLKLVVEVDGEIHEKQKNYDEYRQSILDKEYSVVRVSNEDVFNDPKILFEKIDKIVNNYSLK